MPLSFLPNVRSIAVVGASRNPEKWGYKIVKTLLEYARDLTIYPVNPKAEEILGLKTYSSLRDIPGEVDMIITVVPPNITEEIIDDVQKVNAKIIWMQPGSGSEKAIEKAKSIGLETYYNKCIIRSIHLGRIV